MRRVPAASPFKLISAAGASLLGLSRLQLGKPLFDLNGLDRPALEKVCDRGGLFGVQLASSDSGGHLAERGQHVG